MLFVIFSILPGNGTAQTDSKKTLPSQDTLKVVNSPELYLIMTQKDSNQQMVDLQHLIPSILMDLRYAGSHNFTGQNLYPVTTRTGFLRLPAARALSEVQEELRRQGLGLKIFDAYRPYSATKKIWELVRDERYAANPAKGSGHNRGIAVDLTLIRLSTGKELPMPTGFDNFSDSAHQDFIGLPEEVLQNRNLLKTLMLKHGFKALDTEWWHYSLPDPKSFPILDLDFSLLSKYLSK